MFETQQQLVMCITVSIVLFGLITATLYRIGTTRCQHWLPGLCLLISMALIAIASIWTLAYDQGASLIQGVTLVFVAVGVSVETKSTRRSTSF